MPPRIPSPFRPARPALVEPIQQPLYSRVLVTAAAPEAQLFFFGVSQGAVGQNPVFTNLEVASQLPNPKIFVVRGYRVHIDQNAAPVATNADLLTGMLELVRSYWFRFFIGVKEYLRVPMFYMSSGLGIWASIATAGAEADNEIVHVSQIGQPHFENYFKIHRRPIVIPPQQNFQAEINRGPALATLTGGDRAVWAFLEGDLGREVM